MSKRKIVVISKVDGPLRYTYVSFSGHTPHWKKPGIEGGASLSVSTHDKAKWISLDAMEWVKGSKSSKRTMLTLDEESGRKLFEHLKSVYEPS